MAEIAKAHHRYFPHKLMEYLMHQIDETSYHLAEDAKSIHVIFDVRTDERCQIGLDLTTRDVLNIINMKTLRKTKIDIEGISGMASLSSMRGPQQLICFFYKNGSDGYGTVYYEYGLLVVLLEKAFMELNR